jgi:hypothetical protein
LEHTDRFYNEQKIIPKEMQQVLKTFETEADKWAEGQHLPHDSALAAALKAYTYRQEWIWRQWICYFAAQWLPLLRNHPQLEQAWTKQYKALINIKQLKGRKHKRAKIHEV